MNRTFHVMVFCAAWALIASGCRTIPDQRWPMVEGMDPANGAGGGAIRVLQINEGSPASGKAVAIPGRFFWASDYRNVLAWVKEHPESPLIVYVHGWHHNAEKCNAEKCNGNLDRFRQFIGEINQESQRLKIQSAKRMGLQPQEIPPVQGIYVGWRGEEWSLPAFDDFLDFPTFWERKNASRRVGEGHLRMLIKELGSNWPGRDVVFLGHSLGGNAIYHAIKGIDPLVVDDRHEYILLNPATSESEIEGVKQALKHAKKARIQEPEKEEAFHEDTAAYVVSMLEPRDHRKVTIFQARNDFTVRVLYRISHGKAAGFSDDLITHTAVAERGNEENGVCSSRFDSGMTIHVLRGKDCKVTFNEQLWVISADKKVSDGHGGLWDPMMKNTLVELIAKRIADESSL